MEHLEKENRELRKQVKLFSGLVCNLTKTLMENSLENTTAKLLSEHISDLYLKAETLDTRVEHLELLNVGEDK